MQLETESANESNNFKGTAQKYVPALCSGETQRDCWMTSSGLSDGLPAAVQMQICGANTTLDEKESMHHI